jgi:peptidyl-Lys metalloendopeptidase
MMMRVAVISAFVLCAAALPTTEDGWNEDKHITSPQPKAHKKLELFDLEQNNSEGTVAVQLTAQKKVIDVSSNKGLELLFTVCNIGSTVAKIPKADSPFNGMIADMFVVRDEWGTKLDYMGAESAVLKKDYITLEAKGCKSVTVDIGGQYAFKKDCTHYIRPKAPPTGAHYSNVMSATVTVQIKGAKKQGEVISKLIEERRNEKQKRRQLQLLQGTLKAGEFSYKANCNAEHKQKLQKWTAEAKQWLDKAAKCTVSGGGGQCPANVKVWFGTSSSKAYEYSVTKGLENMIKKWSETDWDCNPERCRPNVFGYVYPSDTTQTVHMCPFTFSYNVYNEKLQTIIHELTHFDHIGINDDGGRTIGDRDFGYGEGLCQSFAESDPTKAMDNADNIGYFVRDVGLDVDPKCKDGSGQCAGWTKDYGCDPSNGVTVSGMTLAEKCPKSCKKCDSSTPGPSPPSPAPTPAPTSAPTPAPTSAPTPAPTSAACVDKSNASCPGFARDYNCNDKYVISGKEQYLKEFCPVCAQHFHRCCLET